MPRSVPLHLVPPPVKRIDESGKTRTAEPHLPEMSLETAKAQIGQAGEKAIGGRARKEFGDPAQVTRFCQGEVSSVLARIWQRPETRGQWIEELARSSGLYDVNTRMIRERRKTGE